MSCSFKTTFVYISRSKENQTMKFCQLIEHNKRNIFFKNHAQNVVKKLVLTPF